MAESNSDLMFFQFEQNDDPFCVEDSAHSFWQYPEELLLRDFENNTSIGNGPSKDPNLSNIPALSGNLPPFLPNTLTGGAECPPSLRLQDQQKSGENLKSEWDHVLFSCLNLSNNNSDSENPANTPCSDAEQLPANPHPNATHLRESRDETTIAKVIFTMFKKYLQKKCPIDLRPYFRVVPYSNNHRTLMDFEVPYLYAEWLDQRKPGSLAAFQSFLLAIKPLILEQATMVYVANPDRLTTFRNYVGRIYSALFSGLDSVGRMKMLYKTPSKLPGALRKLQQIKAKFN